MCAKEKKDKKAEKEIDQLSHQIEELTIENQQLLEKLQRLSADYSNYQKRVPRQIAETVSYEKKSIIRSLLPSLDNFEHALAGASVAESPDALENVIKGIQMVFDHLLDALKRLGVQKVVSVGQPFDPACHEAMMQRNDPDKQDGIVLEEYQACYRLGDDVLRPARVIVNKRPDSEVSKETDQSDDAEPLAESQTEDQTPEQAVNTDTDTEEMS